MNNEKDNTFKHLFVPYEIAMQLKEKGFTEYCFAVYDCSFLKPEFSDKDRIPMIHKHPENCVNGYAIPQGAITAPLWQQVIDWFRLNHEIYITPFIQFENGDEGGDWEEDIINAYMILNLKEMRRTGENYLPYINTNDFFVNADDNSYYGSLNEAILEALKLI